MEIQNLISTMNYTLENLRNKKNSNRENLFSDFVAEDVSKSENQQSENLAPASTIADNGVKSALMTARLNSQTEAQKTQENETFGFTAEELQTWHNGYDAPQGLRWVATGMQTEEYLGGGVTMENGVENHYYHARTDYNIYAYYDENSPEDAPIVYVYYNKAFETSPDKDKIVKIDVNSVDPSNATYEEMLALVGYIYRDDVNGMSEAMEAVESANNYMEFDGLDWENGSNDYAGYYLNEVVRRNKDYHNPANQELAKAAENLLEYLKDYPRGSNKA